MNLGSQANKTEFPALVTLSPVKPNQFEHLSFCHPPLSSHKCDKSVKIMTIHHRLRVDVVVQTVGDLQKGVYLSDIQRNEKCGQKYILIDN